MTILFVAILLVFIVLMSTNGSKIFTGKADKKDVPQDGMEAFSQGFHLNDNPFRNHTPDHSIWRDDFLFASGKWSAK